jgi:hypothetical protein
MKKLFVVLAMMAMLLAVAVPVVAQSGSPEPTSQYQYSASASASSAPSAQYSQYPNEAQYGDASAGFLPDTGGIPLAAVAGALLVAGGLIARKIVR